MHEIKKYEMKLILFYLSRILADSKYGNELVIS